MNASNDTSSSESILNITNRFRGRIIDTINITFILIVLVIYIPFIFTLCINLRLTFEKEETLKWEVYNENTFLVKEIYLIAICISEISYIGIYLIFRGLYVILEKVATAGISGIFKSLHLSTEVKCRFHENPIPILINGFLSVLIHSHILLLCALTRYLTNRYLLRKTNKQLSLLSYGLVSSLIILLFYNKYTQSLQGIAYLFFLVDWFILVRYGRKLSLVLIGRVREIQQCYGNGIMYRQEYQKYRFFRIFNFIFCLGILVAVLGVLSHSAATAVFTTTYKSYCNITGIEIQTHLTHTEQVVLMGISFIEKIIASFGLFLIFTPAFVYSFGVLIRFCTERCKKKNFHDEMIRPLIDRYQSNIIH